MATGPGARRRPSRRIRARRHRARRWTSALLLGLAAFAAVSVLSPSGSTAEGEPTVVARRDIPAGAVLTTADLELAPRPPNDRPRTSLTAYERAVGKVAATPISANDVVTPERLAGPALLDGQPTDQVAVTLPVATTDGLGLGPGDHVDVYALGSAGRVAADVVVLSARTRSDEGFGAARGQAVTVALPPAGAAAVAASLAQPDSSGRFMVALRRS